MFCVNRRTGRNAPVGKGPDPAVHLVAPSARRHASEGLRTSMSSWCVGLSYFTSVPHVSANTDIFLPLAALPLTLILSCRRRWISSQTVSQSVPRRWFTLRCFWGQRGGVARGVAGEGLLGSPRPPLPHCAFPSQLFLVSVNFAPDTWAQALRPRSRS